MLCKIWGFHVGDYEERRLLGYKNPVRTSQETHYVSTTETSRLLLWKIWSFHGGDYEQSHLLGCLAVWLVRTDDSEECIASIIRVARFGELGTSEVTRDRFTNFAACFGCWLLLTLFLAGRFLLLWWWLWNFPPKRRFVQGPHDVTFQKMASKLT
jgi:hypothetical protein